MNRLIYLTLNLLFFTINICCGQLKKVELIRANVLEKSFYMGQPVRKLIGNVAFRHQGVVMNCDSSYQYELKNELESFNHIRIVKSDSQSIRGDHMNYYGDIRLAKITGQEVILNNTTLYLYTKILDYDLERDIANYTNKGTVIDKENKLVSEIGTYYKLQDLFVFIKNVVFTDKKYTIYTDTMEYNTTTKIVKFRGPTRIVGPEGTTYANKTGEYNSITKKSNFKGAAQVNYQDFTLTADEIYYDQFSKAGIANGHVVMFSKKDSVTVLGDHGKYWGDKGKTKVYPQALMQSISAKDTLYLTADTLLAINDTIRKEKRIFAYRKARLFNRQMQVICDSMVNDMIDSTIRFYKDPVMWNGKNQMRGDTIKVVMHQKKIDTVFFRNKAFVVSQDTIQNFNQIKGKNMTAKFKSNKINRVDVKDNAESINYILQGDTIAMGLNHMESVNMAVRFKNQRVKDVAYYKKVKGQTIPPHEIKPEDERLKGFKWRISERPTLSTVIGKYYNTLLKLNKK